MGSGNRDSACTSSSTGIGERRASVFSAGLEPALGQDRRVDPERDLTQLVHYARQPLDDVGQLGPELAELGRHRRLRSAQFERERDELLLRAVVQVALDPPPGRVGGGDDPCA